MKAARDIVCGRGASPAAPLSSSFRNSGGSSCDVHIPSSTICRLCKHEYLSNNIRRSSSLSGDCWISRMKSLNAQKSKASSGGVLSEGWDCDLCLTKEAWRRLWRGCSWW